MREQVIQSSPPLSRAFNLILLIQWFQYFSFCQQSLTLTVADSKQPFFLPPPAAASLDVLPIPSLSHAAHHPHSCWRTVLIGAGGCCGAALRPRLLVLREQRVVKC